MSDRLAYLDTPLHMGPYPAPDDCGAPGSHIGGWLSCWEAWWLHETAKGMDSIVEVGVLRGRSAYALLSGCDGPVYCIDPFADPGDHAFRGFTESCGHFPNLHAIRGFSPAASSEVPGEVDMVWLDGDHAYQSVRDDIDAWLPKTTKLLCGHDWSDPGDWPEGEEAGYRGVWDAVREMFPDERIENPEGTSIWAVWL